MMNIFSRQHFDFSQKPFSKFVDAFLWTHRRAHKFSPEQSQNKKIYQLYHIVISVAYGHDILSVTQDYKNFGNNAIIYYYFSGGLPTGLMLPRWAGTAEGW